MLELRKRKHGGRGLVSSEPADIRIGREIAGAIGNNKKVVIGKTRCFGQVWTRNGSRAFFLFFVPAHSFFFVFAV